MEKLRFGVIGTGWITGAYVDGALDSGLWDLTAIYSRKEERGLEFGKKYGVSKVFTNPEDMAKFDGIDAAYIASPNFLHMEYSKLFLKNGKHVICEKPAASDPNELSEVIEYADSHKLIFMEAIMYMHMPQRNKLIEALPKIGPISLAKFDFCQRSSKYDAYLASGLPNIFNPAMESGALMDLGVYCVYPALDLFGEPEDFHIAVKLLKSGADGSGLINLIYPDKLVSIPYSKLGQASENSEIQGDFGTISISSISRLADIKLIANDGIVTPIADDDEKHKLMGYEAKDFYRYITEPDTSKDEIRKCSEMCLKVSVLLQKLRSQANIMFPKRK